MPQISGFQPCGGASEWPESTPHRALGSCLRTVERSSRPGAMGSASCPRAVTGVALVRRPDDCELPLLGGIAGLLALLADPRPRQMGAGRCYPPLASYGGRQHPSKPSRGLRALSPAGVGEFSTRFSAGITTREPDPARRGHDFSEFRGSNYRHLLHRELFLFGQYTTNSPYRRFALDRRTRASLLRRRTVLVRLRRNASRAWQYHSAARRPGSRFVGPATVAVGDDR